MKSLKPKSTNSTEQQRLAMLVIPVPRVRRNVAMRVAVPIFSHLSLFLLLAVSCLPLVISQAPMPSSTRPSIIEQPIASPSRDDVLIAGTVFNIRWTPNPHFSNITLELWDKTSWGYSRDFGSLCYHWINPFCGTIVSHAPNTGTYEWHIPKPGGDFPRGERVFWIKMYVDDYLKPEIGNKDPVLSYSQNFAFAPEPGQSVSAPVVTSSTEIVPAPVSTSETPPGTVYVTIHDGVNITVVPKVPTRAPAASATALSPKTNSTIPIQSQGAASSWRRSTPFALSLLLGFL